MGIYKCILLSVFKCIRVLEWCIRDGSKTVESLVASSKLSRCHGRGQSRKFVFSFFVFCILYFAFCAGDLILPGRQSYDMDHMDHVWTMYGPYMDHMDQLHLLGLSRVATNCNWLQQQQWGLGKLDHPQLIQSPPCLALSCLALFTPQPLLLRSSKWREYQAMATPPPSYLFTHHLMDHQPHPTHTPLNSFSSTLLWQTW